jgi:hypothetical protein
MTAKLIVTLAALWILVPAIALGGGGFNDEQQMVQKTIVIENHVPADNNGVIIAAVIAGVFTLAGTVVAVRKKS